ncbi:hypothetical protein KC316_g785 [Hortaea werneckii]|uniref:Uncharacterized protein n=1 Tax=Hortaea werneckii TaxID=91943 RepID=A0A3M6Z8A0_HORWE|nr:hypothetical protein KC324_g852 [Hortaea werneckii]KAI7595041.1 hypothetical protein KC316_g785 [Hortaea werneckii]RMY11241.1 hypothetical protein D0868_03253 [Hortaea werneckii]
MATSRRVVLVTGASKGIGKAIALKAASQGACVVVNYHSDRPGAEQVAAAIESDRVLLVQANVAEPSEAARLVKAAVARFGTIDVLVANAAATATVDINSATETDFDLAFGVNVKGPCFLAQAAIQFLGEGSRIIFISSDLTDFNTLPPQMFLYIATKGALNMLVRSLAQSLAKRGIRVNAVSPGPVATEGFLACNDEATAKSLASLSPFERLGEVEEIAAAVSMLWERDSSWISGQVIKVNGAEC